MSTLKIITAAVAAATFGLAFAQGTPPRPATDPAVGAGQRSTQNTPMGTTGTPGGAGTGVSAQGSTAGSAAATTAGSVGATSTPSASMNSGATTRNTTSAGSSMHSGSGTHHAAKKSKKHKVAKADRG